MHDNNSRAPLTVASQRLRGAALGLFICATVVLIGGCSKPRGNLKGSVSFEGKKLAMGQVYVIGSDSNPYYAVIGEDGVYAFKDLPGGICKIAVNSPNPAAAGGRKDGGKDRPKDADNKPADDPKKWIAIPLSYGDQSTSQLEFDIKGGENAFDIKMVKK